MRCKPQLSLSLQYCLTPIRIEYSLATYPPHMSAHFLMGYASNSARVLRPGIALLRNNVAQ